MSKLQPVTQFVQHVFGVSTAGRGTIEISDQLRSLVGKSGIREGVAQVFVHHTSCSLVITENADPDVRDDLERYFARLVPDGDDLFVHRAEGPDDMSAHVRAALTATSLSVPITDGRLALGTWQGVFLWEHRTVPHDRKVTATLIGSGKPAEAKSPFDEWSE
jgi:secondary thiamine-phosphate synthase enzyme